ncbi:hypothetical protein BDK51DRAFT_38261 [Blyttiomyces helicus]|uniref:Uncharacterized protein n=1 Tax=Blyttiomyces helicus TaxID=388810 RepID=A0A4P9W3I4_9FUNG|nr:hypothetical protein BDK51DRAFT_38261 [Blyttiomyces helicus]|eukprot:RKO86881.1 hypothetical protein BDK51DRAFT_38261 [Blyttiomyces helicus]
MFIRTLPTFFSSTSASTVSPSSSAESPNAAHSGWLPPRDRDRDWDRDRKPERPPDAEATLPPDADAALPPEADAPLPTEADSTLSPAVDAALSTEVDANLSPAVDATLSSRTESAPLVGAVSAADPAREPNAVPESSSPCVSTTSEVGRLAGRPPLLDARACDPAEPVLSPRGAP